MRVAVASRDGQTVSGHIGKCPQWIVYVVADSDAEDVDVEITAKELMLRPS